MADKEIRVLLVDDDEDYFILTRDFLSGVPENEFIIEWKNSYDDGLAEIAEKRHDVYLVDLNLGKRNGLELIGEAISLGCRAPIILLTGQGERHIDLKAVELGADDYLEKGEINAKLLERSIRYSLERKKLILKLKDALDRIKALSGLVPICANCKKIRDDKGYWNELEGYIQKHSDAEFSHSLCPDCVEKLYPDLKK